MTGSDQLTEHAREEVAAARAAARRDRRSACAACGCVPDSGRSTSRSAPVSSSASPGSKGTARTSSSTRSAVRDRRRRRDRPPRRRRTSSSARPAQAADHGIAYVPRERRQALFAWMSIRENFGMPTLAATARLGLLRPRLDAAAARPNTSTELGIVLGAPGRRDHDAERRQPAEGRDRALARGRSERAAAQRPHARHRRRREARPLRVAHAPGRRGPGGRDALHASSTSTSS